MELYFERFSRVQILVFLAALCLVVFGYFVSVNDFVTFDDGILITRNAAVQRLTLRTLAHAFTSYDPELYVPLTMVSLQMTHALFGLSPAAFHAGNLLLHIISVCLVFLIMEKLTGSRVKALVVSVAFAIHPINTEAILWASARKDVLSAAFCLGSLFAYIRFREEESGRWYTASILLFGLGLLSKVSIIALPVILFFLDVLGKKTWKESLRDLAPFLGLSVVFGAVALFGKRGILESSSFLETVILTVRSLGFYLGKLVYAWNYSVIYPAARPVQFNAITALSLVTILLLVVVAVFFRKKNPMITLGIVWFFLFVLPNSTNFLKNGFLFAASDRYVYLAMIGIAIALVEWAALVAGKRLKHWSMALGLGVLVLVLSGLSIVQAKTWKSSETLYRNVLRLYPDSIVALDNLGVLLLQKPETQDEGEALIQKALVQDPHMAPALINMGETERKRGNIKEAESYFRRAVEALDAKPGQFFGLDDVAGYYYLAQLLEATQRTDEALAIYRKAVARAPTLGEPHHNLGLMYQKLGNNDEAMSEYAKAIELEPTYIHSHYMLAGLLAERGRLQEAAELLRVVVSIAPNYEKARQHLENIERLLSQ